jgi:hypothetical protein
MKALKTKTKKGRVVYASTARRKIELSRFRLRVCGHDWYDHHPEVPRPADKQSWPRCPTPDLPKREVQTETAAT